MNLIVFIGTAFRWALRQYRTGRLRAADMTSDSATFYHEILKEMSNLNPNGQLYFDAILVDLCEGFCTY